MKKSPPKRNEVDEAEMLLNQVEDEYHIDDPAGLLVISQIRESLERLRAAQRLIRREGMTFTDRFGQRKCHPAVLIERDCRYSLMRGLKELHLDTEPAKPVGRPPGGGGRKP